MLPCCVTICQHMKHSRAGKQRSTAVNEPSTTTPRAFLYARVSTDRQTDQGHSLPDQERRLRGHAQTLGVAVGKMFIEAGVSAAKRFEQRPKGAELLALVTPGDHVVA